MHPVLAFLLFLGADACFLAGALWPVFKRDAYTPVNLVSLGLTLVTLVWVVQAAQAAF